MRTVAVFFTCSACCVVDTMPPPALRSSFEYTAMVHVLLYNYCCQIIGVTVSWAESVCGYCGVLICVDRLASVNQSGYL